MNMIQILTSQQLRRFNIDIPKRLHKYYHASENQSTGRRVF